MKKDTFINVIRQSVLNIPHDCINQEFLKLLADIRYYNTRMNNELKSVAQYPNYKEYDKAKGTDSLKKARSYAKQILEDCISSGVTVNFFKPITIRDYYAKYYFRGKDITTLINI